MKKRCLFLFMSLLAACSTKPTDSSINSDYGDQKTIPDEVRLNFSYNTFTEFKDAYDVFKISNGSFPTLVLDFDAREGYATQYTISGVSSIENRNVLENTKFTFPKFSYIYTYNKFVNQDDRNKAISLELTYLYPLSEIKDFDNTKIEWTSEYNELRLYYSGVKLLSGTIKYDSKYVNIDTVSQFKDSLSKDLKYIA